MTITGEGKFIALALDKNNNVISTSKVTHVVTAGSKKKGTSYVYAYAQNGVAKKIKVTVK